METRILDLDGSLICQDRVIRQSQAAVVPLRNWGPSLRLACGRAAFERFQHRLAQLTNSSHDAGPFLSFLGSGDFHHVSLALLRRLRDPCNLLVIDNHPDWMRGVPALHCGTWLYHAARLPHVRRVFHVGGDVDFDNAYRWLAPWSMLHSGKIIVSPARRFFRGRQWKQVPHQPLRHVPDEPASRAAIDDWLAPFRAELAARPLYVSLDKDVLIASAASVNWDSGHLVPHEVVDVLHAFLTACRGELAGMDVVGDWSPVHVSGPMRRFLHWSEHPKMDVDPDEAARRNERMNLLLLDGIRQAVTADRCREAPADRSVKIPHQRAG